MWLNTFKQNIGPNTNRIIDAAIRTLVEPRLLLKNASLFNR